MFAVDCQVQGNAIVTASASARLNSVMHGKPPPHQETLTSLYLSCFSSEWTEIWHDDLLDGEGQAYHIKICLAAASCLYTLLCQSVCLSYKSQLFLIGVFTKT